MNSKDMELLLNHLVKVGENNNMKDEVKKSVIAATVALAKEMDNQG